MEISVFAVTWTKGSVCWTNHRRFLYLQLLGHKAVFDGQITGNLPLKLLGRKSVFMMDKSMEICVYALLGHKAVFGEHVTGDLCLCSYLDIRPCLMDKSLEIYVNEVTRT